MVLKSAKVTLCPGEPMNTEMCSAMAHVNKGLHGPSDAEKSAYDVFLVTQ
jgi:hypothetical protein